MKNIYHKGAGIRGLEDLAGVKVIIRITAGSCSINVSQVKLLEYHQQHIVPIKQIIQIHFAQLHMWKGERKTKRNFFTRSWNKWFKTALNMTNLQKHLMKMLYATNWNSRFLCQTSSFKNKKWKCIFFSFTV